MLRVFHHWISARKAAYFVAESITLALAATLGAALGGWALTADAPGGGVPSPFALWLLAALIVGLLQFSLYLVDLYDLRIAVEDRGRGERLLRASGAAVMLLALALVALRWLSPEVLGQGTLLGGALGAVGGLVLIRGALPGLLGAPQAVVIVGEEALTLAVTRALDEGGEGAFGAHRMRVEEARVAGALAALVRRLGARHLVVEPAAQIDPELARALDDCRRLGCEVDDAAGFCERALRRLPVATLRPHHFRVRPQPSRLQAWAKRAFDVTVAGTLLLLAMPLMLVVALLIKLQDGGPVFYRQERIGKGGRPYQLWKFRSMRTDAEAHGAVWARTDDDRTTRVGRWIRKTRVDEIPQVLNVLVGDMSFVGPRPERGVFVEQLKTQIPFYAEREVLKPGITGWAQIRYPYGASVEDARNKLEFDLYYVRNASLFLDASIIFHTVRHVLTARGAR
ncbi:MAG TPA: exopolysaccharide biosynthesis polyprenyl glycosylphosphotransferase [Myxococcaceae bacterium]|nr:exopolysaccharide biosynthesis polyprenyl glycosylphosphotransferase [Myxococcaceae bacterium]